MKKLSHFGFIALMLASAVMVIAAPADAIDFAISGQIDRAALYADDGDSGEWFFVDNSNSSTRFRFKGSNKFKDGWSVGLLWEVEMKSNPSSDVSMDDDRDIPSPVTFNERIMDIWVEKKNITMLLGQGDTATNSTSEVDLSDTAVAAYSNVTDVGGGFEFKANGQEIGVSVGDSRSNFDGLSRRDRVRFDSPRWEGFYASLSFEGNSEWDLAARYAGKLGGARLAAAAGWASYGNSSDSNNGNREGQFSSSASMFFKSGLSLTASYAFRDQNGTNPWNLFGKIGYKFKKNHAASIQYSRTKHLSAIDDIGDSLGLAYVFSPWASVDFYGTYYLHMLDRGQGTDPDDISILMAGARVKF